MNFIMVRDGIAQKEVAEKMDMQPSYLSKLLSEVGERRPNVRHYMKLLKTFNLTEEDFLNGTHIVQEQQVEYGIKERELELLRKIERMSNAMEDLDEIADQLKEIMIRLQVAKPHLEKIANESPEAEAALRGIINMIQD